MKRGNIRTNKIYTRDENGNKVTKFAVEVKVKGKNFWQQATKGKEILVFDTPEEADQIIIDIVESAKKTFVEKVKEGKIKPKKKRG